MKKTISIILVFILFISGISAAAFQQNVNTNKYERIKTSLHFSSFPVSEKTDEYVSIESNEIDSKRLTPGCPIIPKKIIKYELPFGATDISLSIKSGSLKETSISKQVEPASAIHSFSGNDNHPIQPVKNPDVYQSAELYPSELYNYDVTCGVNENGKHVTFVTVHLYPVRYQPALNRLHILEHVDVQLSYKPSDNHPFVQTAEYDLVIISPSIFTEELSSLVDHKNTMGVSTYLKTTEAIYNEYDGVDKPEQIKYFIKDAVETQGVSYVLLVGGMNSMITGVSRDDANQGSKDWHVPVRYTNLDVGSYDDPGFISDLYYADLYKEEGVFEDWDSNDNGIFSEWTSFRKDDLDLNPDVYVGRLACRNENEVTIMVNKIINYEDNGVDDSWFDRIIAVAGDAFQDQEDLDILWDTTEVDEGRYTIHAQSSNPEATTGPVDEVTVTVDRSQESIVTFSEDDHLKTDTYPFSPIAEITSPSDGNILGNTDVSFTPEEAYSGYYWANVTYVDGMMHIRGKSYDPQPYGYQSSIRVWITNSDDEIIFTDWRNNTKTYYEDEWSTGNRVVGGRGGSLYYMSDSFEKEYLWTSNGNWDEQNDVIERFSEGSGFVHFSGHASPRTWGDQYPGIPGGRRHASVTGLVTFNPLGLPMFPMSKLSNDEKLPIVVACGCHNGQFNVTLLSTLLRKPYMWTYGVPIPECWSWWLTRLENGGSIATISNTGMGYGMQGEYCIAGGLNPWLDTEFFRLYGQEGKNMLGAAYEQAIGNYLTAFDMDDSIDGIGHVKSVQQWTLLGDPSLKIGGYS